MLIIRLEKGSFFGEGPLVLDEPSSIAAIAEPATLLYKVSKNKFNYLLTSSEIFRNVILETAYRKLNIMVTEMESLCFERCKDRLLNLLVAMTKEDVLIDDNWYKLKARYTQQEISSIIGATRVTIARIIGELCEDGLIRIVNRGIQVKKSVVNKRP